MTAIHSDEQYYSRRFLFGFADCDCEKRASLYSVMQLLSEIAGEDYERRGLGYSTLMENGQAFLLSGMCLNFFRVPHFLESGEATTWERCVSGPCFYRDFEIRGRDNSLLLAGNSRWLLVSPETREILRPASLYGGLREGAPRQAACPQGARLRRLESAQLLGERPIYYSDLDANGHVNNAVYGKIAVDFLPERLRMKNLQRFDISFVRETRADERLKLWGGQTEKGYEINGLAQDNLHFACRFCFE